MDIVTGITALATAGSALLNLLKDLKGTEPNPAFDPMTEKVIELNSRIMDVQSAALALQGQNANLAKQVTDLETQLAKTKDWEAEKKKYAFIPVGSTAFVYCLKDEYVGPMVRHWICCSCYEANRKSILVLEQSNLHLDQHDTWICHGCNSRIRVDTGLNPNSPSMTTDWPP